MFRLFLLLFPLLQQARQQRVQHVVPTAGSGGFLRGLLRLPFPHIGSLAPAPPSGASLLQMPLDARGQMLRLEWFRDVLVGSLFHAPEPVAVLTLTRNHDDLDALRGRRLFEM